MWKSRINRFVDRSRNQPLSSFKLQVYIFSLSPIRLWGKLLNVYIRIHVIEYYACVNYDRYNFSVYIYLFSMEIAIRFFAIPKNVKEYAIQDRHSTRYTRAS